MSSRLAGSHWQLYLYGRPGRRDTSYLLVAYREGAPCLVCGTLLAKIRTGSTGSHIGPECQALEPK